MGCGRCPRNWGPHYRRPGTRAVPSRTRGTLPARECRIGIRETTPGPARGPPAQLPAAPDYFFGGARHRDDRGAACVCSGGGLGGGLGRDELAPALLVGIVLGGDRRRLALFLGDHVGLARELEVDALELAVEHGHHRLALGLGLLGLDVDLALVELLAERLRRQDDVVDRLQRAVAREIDLGLAGVRGDERAIAAGNFFPRPLRSRWRSASCSIARRCSGVSAWSVFLTGTPCLLSSTLALSTASGGILSV